MKCGTCGTALDSRATFCPTCGATAPDPFIGHVISGRYEVRRRIAIGNFGSIYKAIEVVSGKDCALKVMHRELAADTNLIERFRREGVVLRKLLSPNVVATYELGEADGLPFIAMELLEGDTLLGILRAQGHQPWQRVFNFGSQICNALAEAHGLGIIHRDLKPANLFVTADDVVKVLDFGIAKILSSSELGNPKELTIMGTAVGTLEYMAPEQLMGGRADGRTDIYTLGVVLYEVITSKRPFNVAGLELLTVQLSEKPPAPSTLVEVPAEVDTVLLKCLAEDMDERYQDVRALARALDEAVASAPPPAQAPRTGPRAVIASLVSSGPRPAPVIPRGVDTEPVGRITRSRLPLVIVAVAVLAAVIAIALYAK